MDTENICNSVTKQKPHLIEKGEKTDIVRENLKRSAENSPDTENKKRLVFSDITNASKNKQLKVVVKNKKDSKVVKSNLSSILVEGDESVYVPALNDTTQIKEEADLTLYTSALDKSVLAEDSVVETVSKHVIKLRPLPEGVKDFDKQNLRDTFCESRYVPYIFEYYRSIEKDFVVEKYMHRQPEINRGMRAVLVDWMVEVQESFELNHESLYLAVKLVDFYLMKNAISKGQLQLVGATAVLLACKFDERMPPLVDDFLYICDDSYSRSELISMEIDLLKTMDFRLGVPISYRFLRRYARCTGASMETLTLARFILETALMDYDLVDVPDSKMAAAAYYLALQMKFCEDWNPSLEYYTGYKASELTDLVKSLNRNIAMKPNKNLMTIRTKYSHKIFYEVAKIPPLSVGE